MSDDAPPVQPWSDVLARRGDAQMPAKPTAEYSGFREYFDDVIAPTLRDAKPEVQIGYPHLKKRG